MSASDITEEIQTLARADRELSVATDLADARIKRLIQDSFVDPVRALKGIEEALGRHGVDGVVRLLQGDKLNRWSKCGLTKDNVLSSKRSIAREGIQKLPEALREREQLAEKLSDVRTVRQERMQQARVRDQPREQVQLREGLVRTRKLGRK